MCFVNWVSMFVLPSCLNILVLLHIFKDAVAIAVVVVGGGGPH